MTCLGWHSLPNLLLCLSPRAPFWSHFPAVRLRDFLPPTLYTSLILGLLLFLSVFFLVYYIPSKEILFPVIFISKFQFYLFNFFSSQDLSVKFLNQWLFSLKMNQATNQPTNQLKTVVESGQTVLCYLILV